MKALPKVVLALGLLALVGSAALAQTQPTACSLGPKSFGLFSVTSFVGCPFSAIMEMDRTQTLADGNSIQTKVEARMYRDSQGRMRYESYSPKDVDKDVPSAPNMIQILDPVAGYSYVIWPQSATAQRHRLRGFDADPKADEQPQRPIAPASSSSTQEPRPKSVVERLGVQVMEGLLVDGTRTTETIPAHAEGNERPLTVVRESWYSVGMGIMLMEKISDPRSGEQEKRLTNLKWKEPDTALFQVPAGYTIKDQ